MQNYKIENELLERIKTLKFLNEELNKKQNITDTVYITTNKRKEFLVKTLQEYDNEINLLDNEIDFYYNELFGSLNNQKNKKIYRNINLLKELLNTKTEDLNNRQEIIEQKENQLKEKLSQLNIAQLELFNQMITKINKEDLENNILINTSSLKLEYSKIKNDNIEQITNNILKELNVNKEKKKRPHSLDNSSSSFYENDINKGNNNNHRLTRKDFFGLKQKRQLTRAASQEGNSNLYYIGKNNLQNTINNSNCHNNSKNNLSRVSRFHSKFFSQIDN